MTYSREKLVVIVPGSKSKTVTIPLIRHFLERFYQYYGVQAEDDAWTESLRSSLSAIPSEVVVFEWSGGVSFPAVARAAQQLEKFLLQYPDREICMHAKSLGGVVALKALQNNTTLPVKLVVCVATPHPWYRKPFSHPARIVNISSSADTYLQLANIVLYAGLGSSLVPDHMGENIELDNLRHSDFNRNVPVVAKGQKQNLFDFYCGLFR